MIKYAEVLDNTWWNELVPESFPNSSYTSFDEETEQFTWINYLTCNEKVWKYITETKELVIFSREGKPVDIGNYTSNKIKFIDKKDFDSFVNNEPYYLLYDYIRSDEYTRKPLDIDFKRQLIKPLYPVYSEAITTFYGDESHTIKVVEEHDFTTHSRIYWYTNFGRDEEYKIYKRIINL